MIASLVRAGSIGTIVLDDGGVNRLSSAAIGSLTAQVTDLPPDLDLLCIRSGRSGLFAAGADMSEMVGMRGIGAEDFSRSGQRLMDAIGALPIPTVALIDGECHGGALDLVMAFDIRVATHRTRFAHPGARLGIVTGFGGTSRIPDVIGSSAARAMFLEGRALSAADAHGIGMIHEITESLEAPAVERLLSTVQARGEQIIAARCLLRSGRSLDRSQMSLLAERTHQLLSCGGRN